MLLLRLFFLCYPFLCDGLDEEDDEEEEEEEDDELEDEERSRLRRLGKSENSFLECSPFCIIYFLYLIGIYFP